MTPKELKIFDSILDVLKCQGKQIAILGKVDTQLKDYIDTQQKINNLNFESIESVLMNHKDTVENFPLFTRRDSCSLN